MALLTTAAISDFVFTNLKSYFFKKHLDKKIAKLDDKQEFALRRVINESLDEYEAKFPITGTRTTFPFYQSQRIINELLSYRVMHGGEYDLNNLMQAFEAEPNVIPPTQKNVEDLYAIFMKKVNAAAELKKLEIKETFQEEVFLVSRKITALQQYIENAFAGFHADLELQWKDRIDTYVATLQAFKPKTALGLLDALLKSLATGTKKPSPQFLASIEFQRGMCLKLLANKVESSKAFIKAYQADPATLMYEEQAALAYHKIGEATKAIALADQIISRDEFNGMGWAVRLLNTATADMENMLAQVPAIVKKDVVFQQATYITFNVAGAQAQLQMLYKLGIVPSYTDYIPKPITINTISEHSFWINVMVNEYFRGFFFEFHTVHHPAKAGLVDALNDLLTRYFEAIQSSELSAEQYDLRFMLAFTNYLQTGEVKFALEMKKWYDQLKNKPLSFLLICANVLQNAGEVHAAIAVIEETGAKDAEILMLLAYCYLKSYQPEQFAATVKAVNQALPVVPGTILHAYLNHLIELKALGQIGQVTVADFTDDKQFDTDTDEALVRNIAEALINGISPEVTAALLALSADMTDPRALGLVATTLHLAGADEQSLAVFGKFIKEESRDLYHYIRALHNSKKNNKELLGLLENWRLSGSFEPAFARTELQAYKELTNWSKSVEVAEYYLANEPDTEDVLVHYVYALHEEGSEVSIAKLKGLVDKLRDYNYGAPEHVRVVANILIKRKYFTPALDLLYRYASDENNKPLRLAYFMAFTECKPAEEHLWPIKEYDTVEAGHFVKYTLNGKVIFVELNDLNLKNPFNQEFIGCGKGGAFTAKRPMTGDEDFVTIDRIMDKYLCLHDQILEEVHDNPYSGIPLQSFSIDEGNVVESLNTVVQKMLGEQGSRERDRIADELAQYYDFKRSFSEVIIRVYRGDYLAGYFDLVHRKRGINILPLANFNNRVATAYLTDLSTLPILYQMHLQHGVTYPNKFVLSKYSVDIIKKQLHEASEIQGEQLSLTVTKESVVPNFLPENAQENNAKYFSGLLQWIAANCIVEVTERVLDFTRDIDIDHDRKEFLTYFLNTSLLLEEKVGAVLITDDTLYYNLGVPPQKIVSSEHYAKQVLPANAPALDEFIKNKYRGFTLTLLQLNNQYLTKASGGADFYAHCLENLSLMISPNNARIAIEHVKWMVVNSLIDQTQLDLEMTAVFVSLLRSVTMPGLNRNLRILVTEQFKLLGTKQDMVLRCLDNAFGIAGL